MKTISTTKMSSKGQVVIPEDVRKKLNLEAGAQFVVMGDNDVVILKTITPPSMSEFDRLVSQARKEAKRVGLKKSDIRSAIKEARKKKRKTILLSKKSTASGRKCWTSAAVTWKN